MTCYFPLRWYEGPVKEPGKINVVYKRSDSERAVELNLPCGKCVGCLMARSKAWAVRCMHEASLYDSNCFVTLTYDEKHLPFNRSLDVWEFSDFMKRLRKFYGRPGIRFFAAGEYGPVNLRPHYHALLFNHDFEDRLPFKETEAGSLIYVSKELEKLWPKGYSSVTDVTFKSASYVARYNLKKALDPQKLPDGLTKEFVNMSRRPGIGKGWYDKYKGDVFPSDQIMMSGGIEMKPPRFYDNLLDREDPDQYNSLKLKRKANGLKMVPLVLPSGKTVLVNDNDSFRLPVKEEVFRASIARLKRNLPIDYQK